MRELDIEAKLENLDTVMAFVDEQLEEVGCSMKTQMQIDIAVEEVYVNIAHYAYNPKVGKVTIRVAIEISGFSYGAYPTNKAWFGRVLTCCAVPVFPATLTEKLLK